MKKSSFQLKLCAALVFAAFSVGANAEGLVSLQDMVEKVISANPEVQARYHAYNAAGYERDVAKGNFLPKLDLTANYRKQETLSNTDSLEANGLNVPRFNSALQLRQMIFDGFATANEVGRLTHAQRVRYYEMQSAMQDTTLEFMTAYIDTLRFRQLTEYAKKNYIVHRQYNDKIKERVDAGVARRVDLEQASGRLALAEANLLTETTNLHDVTARMQRLLGELPPATLEKPSFVNSEIEPVVEEALQYAYLSNPNILSTIEDIEATQREVKTKRAKYMPTLNLEASKNIDTSSNGENTSSAADYIGLNMNFNLFNGFSDKADISQTVEKLNRSHDLRDRACIETRQTLNIAYNDIKQLKQQTQYRIAHKKSIENAREAYQKQFDIGQRTLLDLLDTENEYFQAKRSLANTDHDMQNAYARLFASQGKLVNKVGAVRQDMPDVKRGDYADALAVCEATAPVQITIDKEALMANAEPLVPGLAARAVPATPVEKVVLAQGATDTYGDKVIPDVQFETSSARIKPSSYGVLDNAIETLKAWGVSSVEVGGHTDRRSTSSEDYNQKLSEKRAVSVMQYLTSHGIDATRLRAVGYGFSQPIAENDPRTGNAANRRVELVRGN